MLGSIVLGLAICVGQAAPKSDTSKAPGSTHPQAQKMKLEGIGNFAEVTPTLYRGAQPTHEGFEALAKMGVNIVVDVRLTGHGTEEREVKGLGMQFVSIPWHCWFPRDELFARFLKVIKENPGKKVFVHCRLGDDRTGMLIASYRMAAEGWSAKEALSEMQTLGLHPVLCPTLASYEDHFPEHLRKNPVFKGLRPAVEKNGPK